MVLSKNEIFNIIIQYIRSDKVIIVYRPVGGIGDAIMILPAITALRLKNPASLIVVLCIDYIRTIFEHNDSVDHIISYTEEELGEQVDIQDLKRLNNLDCEMYFLHHPCPASEYESACAPHIYKSRQEIFSESCGVDFDINNYNFVLHDNELNVYREMGLANRYIVLQLRSHDCDRDYRFNRWLLYGLVKLGKKLDFEVVTVDAVQSYDVKGVLGLYNTPLAFIYGVIATSLLLIGPDSAFPHVAGALQVPTLGLFGPTNPIVRLKYYNANWMPRFTKCTKQWCWYEPCKFKFCMSYKPKDILEKVDHILR